MSRVASAWSRVRKRNSDWHSTEFSIARGHWLVNDRVSNEFAPAGRDKRVPPFAGERDVTPSVGCSSARAAGPSLSTRTKSVRTSPTPAVRRCAGKRRTARCRASRSTVRAAAGRASRAECGPPAASRPRGRRARQRGRALPNAFAHRNADQGAEQEQLTGEQQHQLAYQYAHSDGGDADRRREPRGRAQGDHHGDVEDRECAGSPDREQRRVDAYPGSTTSPPQRAPASGLPRPSSPIRRPTAQDRVPAR